MTFVDELQKILVGLGDSLGVVHRHFVDRFEMLDDSIQRNTKLLGLH